MEPTSIALWLLIIVGVLFIIGKIRDRRLLNSVTSAFLNGITKAEFIKKASIDKLQLLQNKKQKYDTQF